MFFSKMHLISLHNLSKKANITCCLYRTFVRILDDNTNRICILPMVSHHIALSAPTCADGNSFLSILFTLYLLPSPPCQAKP